LVSSNFSSYHLNIKRNGTKVLQILLVFFIMAVIIITFIVIIIIVVIIVIFIRFKRVIRYIIDSYNRLKTDLIVTYNYNYDHSTKNRHKHGSVLTFKSNKYKIQYY